MPHVLLVKEPSSPEPREAPVTRTPFFIGKAPENELVLEVQAASRRHCQLDAQGDAYAVTDLGSRNGTWLDGRRLEPQKPTPFSYGQVLQIGDAVLQLAAARSADRPAVTPGALRTPRALGDTLRREAPGAVAPIRRVTPVELKRALHALLIERMDLKRTDMSNRSTAEVRALTDQVCTQLVQEQSSRLPPWLTPAALVKEVVDEAVGLGLLEDLLADASVDEIMVCGWDKVYVERRGRIEMTERQFTDNAQVIAIIRRILAPLGRRIDESTPLADGRLADGSRVNAIIPPLALSGPTLTIRKFAKTPFSIDDLVNRFRSLTAPMGEFLSLAVRHRANILISGGTGSGKTTLLNVASNFIPPDERIVTIEDAAELQLQQEHVVRLESRPPTLEGKNAIGIRDLVRNALRMRPDRIVVGECRGGEALDMLQAMNTGHDGSLTTLHANSPRDALSRLETLVLMAGMDLPTRAIREQVASAIHFIVQISRLPDGSRRVLNITAVTGMEGDIITLQDIFRFEQSGYGADGRVEGRHAATGQIPEFAQTLRRKGVDLDLGMFRETAG